MRPHERPRLACVQSNASQILSAVDALTTTGHFVDAAFIVSEDLPQQHHATEPLQALLTLILDRIRSTIGELQASIVEAPRSEEVSNA